MRRARLARLITVRIEDVLWHRTAAVPPETISTPRASWMLGREGDRVARGRWMIGLVWQEVGGRYVFLLERNGEPGPERLGSAMFTLPIRGGGTPACIDTHVPALNELAGLIPAEIAAVMAAS